MCIEKVCILTLMLVKKTKEDKTKEGEDNEIQLTWNHSFFVWTVCFVYLYIYIYIYSFFLLSVYWCKEILKLPNLSVGIISSSGVRQIGSNGFTMVQDMIRSEQIEEIAIKSDPILYWDPMRCDPITIRSDSIVKYFNSTRSDPI